MADLANGHECSGGNWEGHGTTVSRSSVVRAGLNLLHGTAQCLFLKDAGVPNQGCWCVHVLYCMTCRHHTATVAAVPLGVYCW
jgi:hypothetical protein